MLVTLKGERVNCSNFTPSSFLVARGSVNWIIRKEESNEICQVESDTA